LILDLDAHCGGGTAAIIQSERRIKQVDVSVCEFDEYADTINSTLTMVDGVKYLATIERVLAQCETQTFDLCLYNAGMDPFKDDVQGGVAGVTMPVLARREALVFDWCRRRHLPVAFVLAGGYVGGNVDVPTLVALHRLTLQAAAGVLMA
jgi:acetoin utilization deacetylase AcuC-like enzyme